MVVIKYPVVTAFFYCKYKAYLLHNLCGNYTPTEYEVLIDKTKEKVTNSFYQKNEASTYFDGILKEGKYLVKSTRINLGLFEFDCNYLLKKEGKSRLGMHFYEPGIFISSNKILKEDRLQVTYLALLLQKIQGKLPSQAHIICRDGKPHRIKMGKAISEMKILLEEIIQLEKNKPRLFLNKHCSQCAFKEKCKAKAIKDDSLTLLNRISEKQIHKYERKGIFSIKQLSFLFKPRRKNKRTKIPIYSYKPELQALAIRTKKIYVSTLPNLYRKPIEIFLDIESIPDEDFFYLFGIHISDAKSTKYQPFWSDSIEEDKMTWMGVLKLLKSYPDSWIYHYGHYEPYVFDVMAKRYATNIDCLKNRFVNLNTFIFGKIYFPTYSNGLKELCQSFGMNWSNKKSSGLQSIVWRKNWETGRKNFKETLLLYNKEDCMALKTLCNELTRIQTYFDTAADIESSQNPKKIASKNSHKMHGQFNLVLKFAHNQYNKRKISVDLQKSKIKKIQKKKKSKGGFRWLGKKLNKPNKSIFMKVDEYCRKHTDQKLTKSKKKFKKVQIDLVFGKNGIRKTTIEYVGECGHCPICNNDYASTKFKELSRELYSHNFKAWFVFQRIEIQLSFTKINKSLVGLIGDKVGDSTGPEVIKCFSLYYKDTANQIVLNILNSPFIHADETTVSIRGQLQYVWIFTTDKHVSFVLSKSRDATVMKDFLANFRGVLITDFYAGYDAIECSQQKCWVHFIRDLNNALWKNPFDTEYEEFVSKIRDIIIPIIQSTYRHGLKTRFLAKHQKNIDKFYVSEIDDKTYSSELCQLYQKRFKRYRKSLFTFTRFDGISWHNNAAENGIRHICVQRKISGSFGGDQFPHYLRMVSIMKTCNLQNKSFLKFLLSKQMDIDSYK
ncbi:MAG: TM0106 family RecB-like putative nuclease [Flavobacteriales bacterium]|nr:TM0106 family RecB-like putative nuclease [Flavobacteriales bacterium]